MYKVLVVYASRTGETEQIANLIAEGIRLSKNEATVQKVNELNEKTKLEDYNAFVFGSSTYHGEMLQGMKNMLFRLDKAKLKGKVGGAFGAFGWSGEAPIRIYATMEKIFDMEMVDSFLRLKSANSKGGTSMSQSYGHKISDKLSGLYVKNNYL